MSPTRRSHAVVGLGDSDDRPGVYLLWIPLGASSRIPVVRWSGRAFEAIAARREQRPPKSLYHAALEIGAQTGRFVVEMTPAWGSAHSRKGAVTSGPVGWRSLGRTKFFRYEVHCWRDGAIPDREYAVGGPQCLTSDLNIAARVLELAPAFPTAVWGRDDQRTGDMWNSNSLVAWLLSRAGIPTFGVRPPGNGRAPGWTAGLVVASREPTTSHQNLDPGPFGTDVRT